MSGRGVTLLMRVGYNYLGVCTDSLFATFSKVVEYLQMLNGVFLFMYILYDDFFLLQLCTVNAAFFSKTAEFFLIKNTQM